MSTAPRRSEQAEPVSRLRRSARIAAKNAAENVSNMPTSFTLIVKPKTLRRDPNMPSRMAEVDMEMQEYEELFEHYNLCFKVKESLQAFQKQLRFLQQKRYLIGFFTAEQLKELHELIQDFHKAHNEWNQKFADEMAAVIRGNKDIVISENTNFHFSGTIMHCINSMKETHNLWAVTYKDVMTVYHLIKNRL